ncbi:hypothetical protein ATKI12_4411 [Kitasatospora sp. Ki12]
MTVPPRQGAPRRTDGRLSVGIIAHGPDTDLVTVQIHRLTTAPG